GTANGVSRFDGNNFVNFTQTHERLAASHINAIHRDRRGVHWFGTPWGVTRLSGSVWSSLDSRDGLVGRFVASITEDGQGSIWFATDKGVTRYTPSRTPPRAPSIVLQADREYTTTAGISIPLGQRVTFHFNAIDTKTEGKN